MEASLSARLIFKIRKVIRELDPVEREFGKASPRLGQIPGWLDHGQDKWLFMAAKNTPDGTNLVEIGSYKGRSTCCLGFGCKGSAKKVFALDTFDGNDSDFPERGFLNEFLENVAGCGLTEYVNPVPGPSGETAKIWNRPIDFIFIDGSHQYEDVLADFEGFFPYVVPGGLVSFHDVDESWPGVFKAWHEDIKGRLQEIGYC